jgi:RNA 2',3'-cyclic 3'-phosphodiesterase
MELPPLIRAFVAVTVPEDVRAELKIAQDQLRAGLHDVSWTRPEAMHLTLHFFGDVESARLREVRAALAAVTASLAPITLAVRGVGEFGGRVVWAGIYGDVDELKQLAHGIRDAVARLGFAVEKREFNPHVTLGRFRVPSRAVRTKLAAWHEREFGTFVAADVELIRSELSPHGSRYTVLQHFRLGG